MPLARSSGGGVPLPVAELSAWRELRSRSSRRAVSGAAAACGRAVLPLAVGCCFWLLLLAVGLFVFLSVFLRARASCAWSLSVGVCVVLCLGCWLFLLSWLLCLGCCLLGASATAWSLGASPYRLRLSTDACVCGQGLVPMRGLASPGDRLRALCRLCRFSPGRAVLGLVVCCLWLLVLGFGLVVADIPLSESLRDSSLSGRFAPAGPPVSEYRFSVVAGFGLVEFLSAWSGFCWPGRAALGLVVSLAWSSCSRPGCFPGRRLSGRCRARRCCGAGLLGIAGRGV